MHSPENFSCVSSALFTLSFQKHNRPVINGARFCPKQSCKSLNLFRKEELMLYCQVFLVINKNFRSLRLVCFLFSWMRFYLPVFDRS